jgi:AraC family transcriptional regulator
MSCRVLIVGPKVKSRLDSIADWDERPGEAKWQAEALAHGCSIGVWGLRHYIRLRFGLGLHEWIMRRRMARALVLLRSGVPVKEVSWVLGYKRASHFSREFKQFYGAVPSDSRLADRPPDPPI